MPAIPSPAELDALIAADPLELPHAAVGASQRYLAECLLPLARVLDEPFGLARVIADAGGRQWQDLGADERAAVARIAGAIAHAVTPHDLADQVDEAIYAGGPVDDGGQFADAPIDVDDAVLLEDVETTLGMVTAGVAVAVRLGGRLNHTATHFEALYLTDTHGVVGLVANIIGVAARTDPDLAAHLVEAVRVELESR